VEAPSLDPQAPDPYPVKLPPGYRPPAPMARPADRSDGAPPPEHDEGKSP
jgi:hypothetical protein